MRCATCNEEIAPNANFCRSCGATASAAPTEPDATLPSLKGAHAGDQTAAKGTPVLSPQPPANPRRSFVLGLSIGGGALALMIVALLATGALGGGSDDADNSTESTTASDDRSASGDDQQDTADESEAQQRSLVGDLESILNESAVGRAEVIAAVTTVCAEIDPFQAHAKLETVITNRQRVLTRLQDLDTTGDAEGARLVDLLYDAIDVSLQSNFFYRDWLSDLSASGCGPNPNDNGSFQSARGLSDQATAAKQAFVAAYNPVAARHGLRSWSDGEF